MKTIVPFTLFVLAACAAPANEETAFEAGPPQNAATVPLQECDAAVGQYALGRTFADMLAAELKKKVGANSVRIIPPDTMVTMDYRGDRLNISYDDKKVITAVTCG